MVSYRDVGKLVRRMIHLCNILILHDITRLAVGTIIASERGELRKGGFFL